MKIAVKTMSPLAARVARAQITTPKNICCSTRTSSSVISSKSPFSGPAEEVKGKETKRSEKLYAACVCLHIPYGFFLPGGLFSTQMLSLLIKPLAQSQWKEPSSFIQASLSPGHAMARSLHSSISVRGHKENQFKHIRKREKETDVEIQ